MALSSKSEQRCIQTKHCIYDQNHMLEMHRELFYSNQLHRLGRHWELFIDVVMPVAASLHLVPCFFTASPLDGKRPLWSSSSGKRVWASPAVFFSRFLAWDTHIWTWGWEQMGEDDDIDSLSCFRLSSHKCLWDARTMLSGTGRPSPPSTAYNARYPKGAGHTKRWRDHLHAFHVCWGMARDQRL